MICLRSDCFNHQTGYGEGAKAWKFLQEHFCSSERPTVVSLVGQLAKLRLGSEELLDDYFVHFVVQERFQPAKTFQEPRTRLRNFVEARRVRQEEQKGSSHVAMQGQRRTQAHHDNKARDSGSQKPRHKKVPKSKEQLTCFNCNKKGHFKKDCEKSAPAVPRRASHVRHLNGMPVVASLWTVDAQIMW